MQNTKVDAFYGFSRLSLYEDINQEGDYYFMRVGSQCMMLPEGIQERASSVDTHETCLLLCRLPNCRSCVRMYPGGPGHQDLRDVEINDQVVSVKACDRAY
ncbi:unnamed protein product [Allacma fusca]|uniref:Uncharacterized protein n=1 Tax=Allacma fusca TaxID=39272 RepID=A0A8J2KRV8_9HEXA|nr:unnamed protein product [Allacma fusca]